MRDDLDVVYICKECKANFLFREDMADHQKETSHSGIIKIPIGGHAEPA